MPAPASVPVAPAIHNALQRITGSANDYEPLLEMMGDAPVVLLGETSHGTHEFYRERARITRRLFEDKEFIAVAVEADWPGAYRVNRWVRGVGSDRTAFDALAGFERFPAGCGVTGTCSPSSNGCAVTTTGGAPRPPSSD